MIVTKLSGGLGNQMFQYATAYTLANLLSTDLSFDLSYYQDLFADTERHFALDAFNITGSLASKSSIDRCLQISPFRKLNNLINSFNLNPRLIKEREVFVFQAFADLDRAKNYYLDGYWQNEKYFRPLRSNLLKEFSLKPSNSSLSAVNKVLAAKSLVGIHIRRGDYLDNAYKPDEEGKCIFFGADYYQRAIALLRSHLSTPTWLLFSDDTVWVKANLTELGLSESDQVFFASDYQLTDQEELIFMSLCKHQVIANSTFGWWAAWLNQHNSPIIIGPKQWVKGKNFNTSDILPSTWLSI